MELPYQYADYVSFSSAVSLLKYGSPGFHSSIIQEVFQETGLDRKTIVDTCLAIKSDSGRIREENKAAYDLIMKAFRMAVERYKTMRYRVSDEDMLLKDPSGYVESTSCQY